MKTIKRISIVLLMFATLQVFSADISIKTNNDNAVEVRVNSTSKNENIKIYDENGKTLYSESIDTKNYLKVFTLKTLPEGQYFIEYENDSQISTASVRKEKNDIILMSDFNKVEFKPVINQKDQFITVGLTNQRRENVDILIYDFEGNEIVNIENNNELIIKKTFDTNRLPKGDYTISVKLNKNVFNRTVTIE